MSSLRIALVLSGGAARGLAHIGVLEALEHEGIAPCCLVGSSMGGLIGALSAAGRTPGEIASIARHFRFPWWFVPGAIVSWDSIFPSAAEALEGLEFDALPRQLLLTAVDVEQGCQVVLSAGAVLPATRATCAVPGVLAPVRLGGRWLIDGGVVNMLPVDVASLATADLVIGVRARSNTARRMPALDWRLTSWLARLGRVLPNPATAKVSFEILVRAAEIALDQSATLAASMVWPDLMIDVDVGNVGVRDFDRLDEAVRAGRVAAERVLPKLERLLATTEATVPGAWASAALELDPVCGMVTHPARARASSSHLARTYYFCSTTCREAFERDPAGYLAAPSAGCADRSS